MPSITACLFFPVHVDNIRQHCDALLRRHIASLAFTLASFSSPYRGAASLDRSQDRVEVSSRRTPPSKHSQHTGVQAAL
eukprot:COSAG02_NODE_307_length_25111_cov_5.306693_6_plen_79_part_00